MGRKKRKVAVAVAVEPPVAVAGLGGATAITDNTTETATAATNVSDKYIPRPNGESSNSNVNNGNVNNSNLNNNNVNNVSKNAKDNAAKAKTSSGYTTTSHSAEIIDEDIYVSDGSESDEDLMTDLNIMQISADANASTTTADGEGTGSNTNTNVNVNVAGRSIEMVLSGSKMGLMRRGIHRPQVLVQPNRQWARQSQPQQQQAPTKDSKNDEGRADATNNDNNENSNAAEDVEDPAAAEERRKQKQEEELAKLDPAQRAARLLAEKLRKLEEAKIMARNLESEENAGRDPCLFSKRTSFDIRFDQIDDKPWMRGQSASSPGDGRDMTDFFNYGFSEEDWLEYGEQQLMIRQELIDANRQKRPPDPSIVPVIPKVR